jgi:hypothetical protein
LNTESLFCISTPLKIYVISRHIKYNSTGKWSKEVKSSMENKSNDRERDNLKLSIKNVYDKMPSPLGHAHCRHSINICWSEWMHLIAWLVIDQPTAICLECDFKTAKAPFPRLLATQMWA